MSTVQTKPMTAEEFWEWGTRPENTGRRCELVRGEVIDVPPPGELHGALNVWIGYLLLNYTIQRGRGTVHGDTSLVVQRGPDTVRGPDVMLIDEERTFGQLGPGKVTRVPALVVEIFSPFDRWGGMNQKVEQYHRLGVGLIWVVDPEGRIVTVHRVGELTQTADEDDVLTGDPQLPGLTIPVRTIFSGPAALNEGAA